MRSVIVIVAALILAALFAWLARSTPMRQRLTAIEVDNITLPDRTPPEGMELAGVDVTFPTEIVSVEITSRPDEIAVGQAFILEARFRGGAWWLIYQDGMQTDTGYTHLPMLDEELAEATVGIEVASARIMPALPQVIGPDLETEWSVSFDAGRDHRGMLALASDGLPEGVLKGEVRIDLVESRGLWSWIGVVGFWVTLAGALAGVAQAIWGWQDRRDRLS